MAWSGHGPSPCAGYVAPDSICYMSQPTPGVTPTNVRLDSEVRERLDAYATRTHRTLTASMNLLLDVALRFAESGKNLDDLVNSLSEESP